MTDVYVAPDAPNLKTTIILEDKKGKEVRETVQFEHGRLELHGEEAAAFADLLKRSTALRSAVRKVNRELGEAIVAQHQAAQREQAVKGGFSTEHLRKQLQETMAAKSAIAALTTPEEVAKFQDELAHDDILLVEQIDTSKLKEEHKQQLTAAVEQRAKLREHSPKLPLKLRVKAQA